MTFTASTATSGWAGSNDVGTPPALRTRAAGLVQRLQKAIRPAVVASATPGPQDLADDSFCREMPGPRTAIELFAGQWSSRLPPPFEDLTGAISPLFDDARIRWADSQMGGVRGMRVVELGPLEGGHTFMLERLGAAEITAIEANRGAFLRCLIVKDLLGLNRARFLCGDFVTYLGEAARTSPDRWDLCLAVGVLYHQQDPVLLLDLASRTSDRILLWTHYYDERVISSRPELAVDFTSVSEATTAGFRHTLYRHEYGAVLGCERFCGGLVTWTSWMSKEDILGCLDYLGFEVLEVGFDQPDHPNGPAVCIAAARRSDI